MDHAWLDSLSEDWVSEPRSAGSPVPSLPSFSNSTSISSQRAPASRIPKYDSQKRAWATPADGDSSALVERTASQNNKPIPRPSQSPSKLREVTNGSRGRRTISASSNASTQCHTVQHKSHSLSPKKSTYETPDWKRRLLQGEVAYGEQRDLFSPAGLENIFRPPPTQPSSPAKLQARHLGESSIAMPSSPPPYNLPLEKFRADDSIDDNLEDDFEDSRLEETREEAPQGRRGPQMKYKLTEPTNSDFSVDDLSRSSTFRPRASNSTGRGELEIPSDVPSLPESSVIVRQDLPERAVSGQSDLRNEELSPIYMTRNGPTDSKISYGALNLPVDELKKRLEQIRQDRPVQSIEAQMSSSVAQRQDMTTDTDDFALNGNFVNNRRGGYSQEGSFQHRMLSPSSLPPIDESVMLPDDSMQASTPKELTNIQRAQASTEQEAAVNQPMTPRQSPQKSAEKVQTSSSGSPLKLFGNYDTFTNQKLLRRLSQFESSAEGGVGTGGSRSGLESTRAEINEAFVSASSPQKPLQRSRSHEGTNRKYNSFGEGELDSFQFSEGFSHSSNGSNNFENDQESPALPSLNPNSHPSFRFQLEPSPALEENVVVHRRTKHTTVTKKVINVRGGNRPRSSSSISELPMSQIQEDLQTPRKRNGSLEGKRLPKTPLRDPTPKRRRTLHETDIDFEGRRQDEEQISLRETHQQMQSVIGRKRKDARNGDFQQAANPSVLAMRQILRPRTPSQSQRSFHQHEHQLLGENGIETDARTSLQQKKIAKIQAELDATGPLKMSAIMGMSQQMQNDSRKGSVTTQDFLDEAKKIMAGIRGKARSSGLASLEESESENDRNQSSEGLTQDGGFEDSFEESTQEPFSRPPSREGGPITRLPLIQEDPALLDHLRKYQEKSGLEAIVASSIQSIAMMKEASEAVKDMERMVDETISKSVSSRLGMDNVIESDPPNMRVSENPDAARKRKHSTSSARSSEHSLAADFPSHSSSGQSTARSIPTGSSRGSGSDTRRVIAPHTVSHLIPEQLAGMIFDRESNKWVKRRSVNGANGGRNRQNFLPSDETEDDPFGDIPDLSVDETQELKRMKAAKMREEARAAQEEREEVQPRLYSIPPQIVQTQAQPKPMRNISPTVVDEPSSQEPSKLTQFAVDAPSETCTRSTSWDDNDVATKERAFHAEEITHQKTRFRENGGQMVEEFEREISILEDRVAETPRRRNVTISFSSPLESIINSPNKYANDVSFQSDVGAAIDLLDDFSEEPENGTASIKNKSGSIKSNSFKVRSALRKSSRRISVGGLAFSGRPISRIEEREEESFREQAEDQNQRNVSIIVTTPAPAIRKDGLAVITPRPAHEIGTLTLTPMSDFTMHQADESLGLDVSYVAGNQRYVMGSGRKKSLSRSIMKLVEKITEVEPFEPYWTNMKELGLAGKDLPNLHKLDEFCEELEILDVSRNHISQLDGVPHTLRNFRITHNNLSDLTSWGHLRNLQYIDVSNNQIESLSVFRSLIHLRGLRADNNQIRDLSGVAQLDGLLSLRLRGNSIQKLDFKGTKLQRLTELDLKDNHISSVEHLEELRSLSVLNLDDNHLSELKVGESEMLWSLRYLKLCGNSLDAIDVSKYPNLRLLYLDRNRMGKITGLLRTKHLDSLSMREQQVDCMIDSSFLSEAFEIRKLFLSGNLLGTFKPRADFLNLQYLELANCGLESLPTEFGQMIANCRILNLNYNAITDLKPLIGIIRLKKLHLAGNRLQALRPATTVLSHFPSLSECDLRGNPFTVGFYSPLLEQAMIIHQSLENEPNPAEPYQLGKADAAKDSKYNACLDMHTKMMRRIYEILTLRTCRRLKTLDGLAVDRPKSELRDKVWDALVDAGILCVRSESKKRREQEMEKEVEMEASRVLEDMGVETRSETKVTSQEARSSETKEVRTHERRKVLEGEKWQAEDSFA